MEELRNRIRFLEEDNQILRNKLGEATGMSQESVLEMLNSEMEQLNLENDDGKKEC